MPQIMNLYRERVYFGSKLYSIQPRIKQNHSFRPLDGYGEEHMALQNCSHHGQETKEKETVKATPSMT
jgi:hypothetical protein